MTSERLIDCEDCGKSISRRALTCPECGGPVVVESVVDYTAEQAPKERAKLPAWIIIVGFAAGAFAFKYWMERSKSPQGRSTSAARAPSKPAPKESDSSRIRRGSEAVIPETVYEERQAALQSSFDNAIAIYKETGDVGLDRDRFKRLMYKRFPWALSTAPKRVQEHAEYEPWKMLRIARRSYEPANERGLEMAILMKTSIAMIQTLWASYPIEAWSDAESLQRRKVLKLAFKRATDLIAEHPGIEELDFRARFSAGWSVPPTPTIAKMVEDTAWAMSEIVGTSASDEGDAKVMLLRVAHAVDTKNKKLHGILRAWARAVPK